MISTTDRPDLDLTDEEFIRFLQSSFDEDNKVDKSEMVPGGIIERLRVKMRKIYEVLVQKKKINER